MVKMDYSKFFTFKVNAIVLFKMNSDKLYVGKIVSRSFNGTNCIYRALLWHGTSSFDVQEHNIICEFDRVQHLFDYIHMSMSSNNESEDTSDAESEDTSDAESEDTSDAESEDTSDAESEDTIESQDESIQSEAERDNSEEEYNLKNIKFILRKKK